MSRSYRHTSICGLGSAASEEDDKRRWHRRFRQRNRQRVRQTESHYPSTLSVIPGPWRKMGRSGLTGDSTHGCCANDTALTEHAPEPGSIKSL
jgi:hypothetical protein